MSVPQIEIDLLITFQRVVTLGSISKTADDMYLSVSAVTGRIRTLEQEIGARLFVRTGRRIELTAAGAAFVKHVERFMELIEEGRSRIHTKDRTDSGQLHIAATPFFTSYLLPDMIKRFREKYPMVRLKLSACSNSQVLNLVSQGKADIGMVQEEPKEEGLIGYPLYHDLLISVVSKGHPLTRLEALSSEDARAYPVLGFQTSSEPWAFLEQWFSRQKLFPRVLMNFDHPETLKRYLEPFDAIAFLPGLTIADELKEGELVSLRMTPEPNIGFPLFMVFQSGISNSPNAHASQAFSEFASQAMAGGAG